jgi:protoheme IX farnesyltransferase
MRSFGLKTIIMHPTDNTEISFNHFKSGLSLETQIPSAGWRDFLSLIKPEVTFLVILAAGSSYLMAPSPFSAQILFAVLVGTTLISGGTATLNHYLERNYDAMMHRTMNRPLPSGRLSARVAFILGVGLSLAGALLLYFFANPLTSGIGLLACLSYLGVYTPLKRRTSACTFVGAFPGAAPALMGWTAATGKLNAGGWFLFCLLLLWQIPHFLSIAWIYREDYQRAGMLMLPASDSSGDVTFRRIFLSASVLIPLSLAPGFAGNLGMFYSIPALFLGFSFLAIAWQSGRSRSRVQVKLLLHASVLYLPLLYSFMLATKWSNSLWGSIQ